MIFSDNMSYSVQLAVQMLYYCGMGSEKTANMTGNEILKHLSIFFTEDEISEAKAYWFKQVR